MAGAHVAGLFRYPVKGLSAEALDRVPVTPATHFPLDRAWAIAKAETPFDAVAPRPFPKSAYLMLMRDEALAALSTRVDEAARRLIVRRDGAMVLDESLESADGRDAIGAWFGELLGMPGARVVSAPGFSFPDVAVVGPELARCVSVINLASVRALEEVVGADLHPLRFRANIYLEGLPPFVEFEWIGQTLRFGDVTVRGVKRTQRCAATNVNPLTAARDRTVPAALLRAYGHMDMGIYVDVVTGGELAPGAAVAM